MGEVLDFHRAKDQKPALVPECGAAIELAAEGPVFVYEGIFQNRHAEPELEVFLFLLCDGDLHVYQAGIGLNASYFSWIGLFEGMGMMLQPALLVGLLEKYLGFTAQPDETE